MSRVIDVSPEGTQGRDTIVGGWTSVRNREMRRNKGRSYNVREKLSRYVHKIRTEDVLEMSIRKKDIFQTQVRAGGVSIHESCNTTYLLTNSCTESSLNLKELPRLTQDREDPRDHTGWVPVRGFATIKEIVSSTHHVLIDALSPKRTVTVEDVTPR